MAKTCYIQGEFAAVRLLDEGTSPEQVWRGDQPEVVTPAPVTGEGASGAAPGGETPRDAIWWKARALDAAKWVAERLGAERAIGAICIDIAGASCVWLAAPSAARRVIGATLRQEGAEWTDLEPGGLIEPLAAPTPGARSNSKLWEFSAFGLGAKKQASEAPGAMRMPVLLAPDALHRIFLDELDRRGVAIERVTSLWHAACAAWLTDSTRLGAVALCDGTSVVWAWGRGPMLVAGGRIDLSAHRQPTPPPEEGESALPAKPSGDGVRPRLALDWLTWAAQLGEAPAALVVVGPGAEAMAAALDGALPGAETKAITDADPLASTLRAALHVATSGAAAGVDADDPRVGLVSLARRRGRAHRRLYTWVGACLAALAMGVGALGWRARDQRAALESAATDLKAEQALVLKEIAPDLAGNTNPARALESRLAELRKKSPEFKDPTPAKPILDEAARLATLLADLAPKGVKLDEIQLHDIAPSARLTAPDFATGEEITARLKQPGGAIRWRVDYEGNVGGDNLKYRLTGEWVKEGA